MQENQQNNNPAQPSPEQIQANNERREKIKQYLRFLKLDQCTDDTQFLDINYDNGELGKSRVLIALGNFAFHARSVGKNTGPVFSEKLGMHLDKEEEFDVIVSHLRYEFRAITLQKIRNNFDGIIPASEEELKSRQEFSYTLTLFFSAGNVQIPKLSKQFAVEYKKIIYAWATQGYATKPMI